MPSQIKVKKGRSRCLLGVFAYDQLNIGKIKSGGFLSWAPFASRGTPVSRLKGLQALSRHYYNGGNHIPFPFQTQKEKDAIYSIMWQYRREE